jgi:hypothetical protein
MARKDKKQRKKLVKRVAKKLINHRRWVKLPPSPFSS